MGKVLLGVKQACNQAFRALMPVEFVAVAQQHTGAMSTTTYKNQEHNDILFSFLATMAAYRVRWYYI